MSMQTYYLVFQLGSYDKGPKILNIVESSFSGIFPESYDIKASVWSRGKRKSKKYKDCNKLLAYLDKLKDNKFNEMTINVFFDPIKSDKLDCEITHLDIYQMVSPMSCLWGDVYGYILENSRSESMRSHLESIERKIKWNELSRYPTLLLYLFELKSNSPIDNIKQQLADNILLFINHSVDEIEFGCVDILTRPPMLNMLDDLAPHPKTYNCLDEKFDALHDFLIGNKQLSKELYECLINNSHCAELIEFTEHCDIVWLPFKGNDIIHNCYEYFVKKDSTTAPYEDKPEKGEIRIKNFLFYTKKRYMELIDNRMIPTIDNKTIAYFEIIGKKYLSKADIDPDDVLMTTCQPISIKDFYPEIDFHYENLKDIENEKKRIWQAHKKTYENPKYWLSNKEVIKKIKELFFNDVGE